MNTELNRPSNISLTDVSDLAKYRELEEKMNTSYEYNYKRYISRDSCPSNSTNARVGAVGLLKDIIYSQHNGMIHDVKLEEVA